MEAGGALAIYPALASSSRTQPIARKQYSSSRRPPPRVPQVVDHNSLHMQNGEEGHMFEYVDHNPTTGLSLNDLANNDIGMRALQADILIQQIIIWTKEPANIVIGTAEER